MNKCIPPKWYLFFTGEQTLSELNIIFDCDKASFSGSYDECLNEFYKQLVKFYEHTFSEFRPTSINDIEKVGIKEYAKNNKCNIVTWSIENKLQYNITSNKSKYASWNSHDLGINISVTSIDGGGYTGFGNVRIVETLSYATNGGLNSSFQGVILIE